MLDSSYDFGDGSDENQSRKHQKQPSTVSPLDTLAHSTHSLDDVDMGGAAIESNMGHHYADQPSYLQALDYLHRSRSADPPMHRQQQQQQQAYHLYPEGDSFSPGNSDVPSLSPIHLTGHPSSTPGSPYPPMPQSSTQVSSFAFPPDAGNSAFEPAHTAPEYSLPYKNTRASRHKAQRSLSAGDLSRAGLPDATSYLTRNNSLGITPRPIQDCEPAQIPVKNSAVGAGAFVYKLYKWSLSSCMLYLCSCLLLRLVCCSI